MRVLIIGGTGFIGYHAVLECVRRGHQVTATARNKPAQGLLPDAVSFQLGDVNQMTEDDLKRLLAGHDAVVYAAGVDTATPHPKPAYDYFYRENVQPCVRLFTAAREVGVTRGVILGSYFSTLDRLRPELRLSTLHPYIRSRNVQAEEAIRVAMSALQLMILELPWIFGAMPAGRASQWAGLVNYVRSPYPLFFTSGGTAAVSVKHVAEAVVGAIERGQGGERYPIGEENLTWIDLLGRLSHFVGRPKRVIAVPTPIIRGALGAHQILLQLRGLESGLTPLPYATIQTSNMFLDPAPARAALGFGQGDLDRALQATIQASPQK
jgi:dihydroflavonol-4-reductase